MKKNIKKLIFSEDEKDLDQINEILTTNYEIVIDDLFNTGYRYLKESSNKDKINLFLSKIEFIIEQENNLKNLKYICRRIKFIIKRLDSIKNRDTSLVDSLKEINTLLEGKILSHNEVDIYHLGHYLVFNDRSIDKISKFINTNPDLLLKKDKHDDDLFYNILSTYVNLEEDDTEEIDYFRYVINLFLINENYDVILNNRLYYLTLLQLPTNKNKEHVKEIINRLQTFYKVPIEELEKKYNVRFSFDKKIEEEVYTFQTSQFNRENLVHQECITIDSEYARCFDDGIYLEKNTDGTYTLYVHISAVADLINPDSLVRNEAFKRGKTVYLLDNNILMYPEYLSKELCSLKQGNNRNVFSFVFTVDNDFSIIEDSFRIQKSKINVKKRLSYEEADRIMFDEENTSNLKEMLQLLSLVSYRLKAQNSAKEKYRNIENTVNHSVFHESRYADLFASANIVQELMILTNQHVARYFYDKGLPFIYRVHENMQENYDIDEINKMLSKAEFLKDSGSEDDKLIKYIGNAYLNARYSPENLGHFGLNLDTYSHCTSAIWRYCDSELQYLMNDLLFSEISDNKVYDWENRVKEVCEYLNYRDVTNASFKNEYEFLVNRGLIRKKVK